MSAVGTAMGWIFRQGIVFILILAAIAFYQFILPTVSDGTAKAEWTSFGQYTEVLRKAKDKASSGFKEFHTGLSKKSVKTLTDMRNRKSAEKIQIVEELEKRQGIFASIRPRAIIDRERLKLNEIKLGAEIDVIIFTITNKQSEIYLESITYPSLSALNIAKKSCIRADKSLKSHTKSKKGFIRNVSDWWNNTKSVLEDARKLQCTKYWDKKHKRDAGLRDGQKARDAFEKSKSNLTDVINSRADLLHKYIPDEAIETFKGLLWKALLILMGIIVMPFAIRTFLYYVLAPVAERRGAIRLSVSGGGLAPIHPGLPSRISLPLTLDRTNEILVRQDYLQSTSLGSKKRTRWLLDYRHILSSIASGLVFLTHIKGEGETTTVSAVRDPFAELTEVDLPLGAACVLHPRALVAVVQPIGNAIRITSHWRLFTLNAYLTQQLRFIVFHGPARLILKGGRGIRVESAERGRIFGQDQLVGFSADLAYSVTRTETFAPYLFGREQLYKDKVEEGSGILIIEEAPLSSRQGSEVRRGIEGMLDAGMKAFGL